MAAAFPDVESAAAASAAVTAARLRPAILELVDATALGRIAAYLGAEALAGTPLETVAPGEAFLLAQSDTEGAAAEAARIAEAFAGAGGRVTLSTDAATGERLLDIRRAMHPALAASGQVLIEDVAVPRSRLPEMFRAIEEIGARYGIEIPTVAHAGDGNLHPNFVVRRRRGARARLGGGRRACSATAVALGGTLTGEHGVGVLKRRWLADELGDDSFELQRGIKALFDPTGILNPGVMFEAPAR